MTAARLPLTLRGPWVRRSTRTRNRNRSLRAGLVLLGLCFAVAALGHHLAPYDPNSQDLTNKLANPSTDHLLGTDALGRDVLSRIIVATRLDIVVGVIGAAIPFVIGSLLGAVAGYFGGLTDAVLTKLSQLTLAFPWYIIAIFLVTIMGPGLDTIVIAYATFGWVKYARITRARVITVKSQDFVSAAHLGGIGHTRLVLRHILPNSFQESASTFVLNIMTVILLLSTFSYLGLGNPPPDPEWGAMIANAQPYLQTRVLLTLAPGVALGIVGLGFILVSEALEAPEAAARV